ncbi:peptidoglycan D,D-transpeptidase FtsI family protein [Tumebacillus permanentifrigoris]|uniref:Cell division protein FtsI/penicillin-binding protein 2 n=1 Tax=Tumebacillus permanentifrigoris TaxID=378543 RepID=A0A316D2Q6_9BACL|nr:penicillin-binding protein 2 [Tumebacillus permanentifrigoris]PWK05093.1 cell division protein FtsI/penicillin-binding protein 2 [Tumebacillus permanentifrigoris]
MIEESAKNRIQRRTAIVLTLCSLGIVGMLGRIFYIQVAAPHNMQGHDLVASAVEQRREKFELDSGRGDILDRNGVSMTGSELHGIVVLPVWQQSLDRKKINDLAVLLHTSTATLLKALAEQDEPFLLRLPDMNGQIRTVNLTTAEEKQVEQLELTGIYAKQVKVRYDDQSVARQVIGFLGEDPNLVANTWGGKYPLDEKVGKLGLEFQYQDELRGLGLSSTIAYYTDAYKRPINGLGIRESSEPNHALNVKTTLDTDVQHTVEQAMDAFGVQKGAVVVLDAQSEDVLAMASRPNFDQNSPIKSADQYPENLALQAVFPGSIFKSVIAAAALETGAVKPTDTFECPGYIDIGDGRLNCWTKHGALTAEEAFASSCNVTFAQLSMKLGRDKIEEYAKKFELGQTVGLLHNNQSQFYGEDAGSIFAKDYTSDRLLANTGIGQEDVRVTPLQAAHMVAVIANNGLAGHPRLVKSLNTPDGLLYSDYSTSEKQQVLEKTTASELQKWMRDVVTMDQGTAHAALADAKVPVAGKTGTAQTGDPNANHQWFAGFAPADKPKYVVVVVAESVTQGRSTEQIAKQIVHALPES